MGRRCRLRPSLGGRTLPPPALDPIEKFPQIFVREVFVVAGIKIVKTFLHEYTDSPQLSLASLQEFHGLAQRFVGGRSRALWSPCEIRD
jgi:hypothetical protein